MFGLGAPELLLIVLLVLIVFGAGKLPQVFNQLGKSVKEFREGAEGGDTATTTTANTTTTGTAATNPSAASPTSGAPAAQTQTPPQERTDRNA